MAHGSRASPQVLVGDVYVKRIDTLERGEVRPDVVLDGCAGHMPVLLAKRVGERPRSLGHQVSSDCTAFQTIFLAFTSRLC
jgi:hypothetical protein